METTESLKRKPTLADAFIAHNYTTNDRLRAGIHLRVISQLQAKVRKAKKYVFDNQASIRMAEVVRDIPELLIEQARFARAPYGLTWIEYNSSLYWNEIYANHPAKLADAAPDHATHLGILIDDDFCAMVAGGAANKPNSINHCYVTPFVYTLNIAPQVWDIALADQTQHGRNQEFVKETMGNFLWGSTADDVPADVLYKATQNFAMHPVVEGWDGFPWHKMRSIMSECTGDLRNVIACLLMLNRPTITKYVDDLPQSRGWLKNKLVPYWSHTTVTINLDPKPILRLIGTDRESGVTKRRHEVEGHYCHDKEWRDYGTIAGCIHEPIDTDADWIPLVGVYAPSTVEHWVCKVCGGKRWWRSEHLRGDANKGWVIKDRYNVKP